MAVNSFFTDEDGEPSVFRIIVAGLGFVTFVSAIGMWGCPRYEVYHRTLIGQAELQQATWNRQIKVQEAEAAKDAAKHLAQGEIERARGVAEANKIIGASLHNNEEYLKYLWIHNLAEAEQRGAEIIYVPTESNLPILEAGRRPALRAEQ